MVTELKNRQVKPLINSHKLWLYIAFIGAIIISTPSATAEIDDLMINEFTYITEGFDDSSKIRVTNFTFENRTEENKVIWVTRPEYTDVTLKRKVLFFWFAIEPDADFNFFDVVDNVTLTNFFDVIRHFSEGWYKLYFFKIIPPHETFTLTLISDVNKPIDEFNKRLTSCTINDFIAPVSSSISKEWLTALSYPYDTFCITPYVPPTKRPKNR